MYNELLDQMLMISDQAVFIAIILLRLHPPLVLVADQFNLRMTLNIVDLFLGQWNSCFFIVRGVQIIDFIWLGIAQLVEVSIEGEREGTFLSILSNVVKDLLLHHALYILNGFSDLVLPFHERNLDQGELL